MGKVTVAIGGRSYPLSCRDGDESHLTALAASVADKAEGLTRSLGSMSEARLLLMAALTVADELHEIRGGGAPIVVVPPETADPAAEARLASLVARAEQLADALDG
ncbi:hypothetical protein GCM10011529_10910 [Polymorphobacter glacialis]|uniref:Cell division protein ZapA n=1 Tax=Sandarakinorhabdus glacialis TaxID=1614636 RepID=A0A917E5F7_9SPHN|nr:cell division protein ZapA [Polymorphobacter glacialis]GGE06369.1 hypothetical protein GCM10011529_10910 [Polymorphobacter glacialis]